MKLHEIKVNRTPDGSLAVVVKFSSTLEALSRADQLRAIEDALYTAQEAVKFNTEPATAAA